MPRAPDAFAETETPKGYTPAHRQPHTLHPRPQVDSGPGLDIAAPDGSTKIVKAEPSSPYARETDGTKTCKPMLRELNFDIVLGIIGEDDLNRSNPPP